MLATVVTWPVIAHAGIPGFFHDWTWSPFRDRTLDSWYLNISAWSLEGLGKSNSVPTVNPLAWLKVGLAVLLPGGLSAKAYLWLSIAAACAGVYRLAGKTFRLAPVWAAAAACIFAGSPYLYAKIASGQSSEWAAIAAFAWGLSFAIDAFENGNVATAAAAALLFALSTAQLQVLVFAEVALLAAALIYWSPRSATLWSIMAIGAAVFAIPAAWFLSQRGPLYGADVSPPYQSWEYSQSSSLSDTFALLGYSARYPETYLTTLGQWALPMVRWASWTIAVFAAAGLVIDRSRRGFVLALLGVVGVLWISGVQGPASSLWSWFFANVSISDFLREFFHAATLVAIPYAVLSALALAWLADLSRSTRIVSLAFAILLAASSGIATWLGGLHETLPHITPSVYADAVLVEAPRKDGRVLFMPSERPLYVAGDRVGGVDDLDWAGRDQESLFEYYPPGPLAFANASLSSSGYRGAMRILPRLACDAIVWRPDVFSSPRGGDSTTAARSSSDIELQGGAALTLISAPPVVSGARIAQPLPSSLTKFSNDTSIVYVDVPGVDPALSLPRLIRAPDPTVGWVGYRDLFDKFEDGLATPTLGIVTTKAGASISLPASFGEILLWAPDGAIVNGRRVVAPQYERVRSAKNRMNIVSLGRAAVGEVDERPVRVDTRPSQAHATMVAPWKYAGSMTISGAGIVVLRQGYDPGWTLNVKGLEVAAHYRADGFANAWLVRGNGVADFSMDYEPQRETFLLLAISLLGAVVLAFIALRAASQEKLSQFPNGE